MGGEISCPKYEQGFFDYIQAGSTASARIICPILQRWFDFGSVLDVGCGQGAWCKVWADIGVGHVCGVDGDYVDLDKLLIARSQFSSQDLSQAFELSRRFDLVVSLEVAEHIPESSAEVFVDNLVKRGDIVLFSAAVPGQGGLYHVNEQPLEYWRRLFAARGYRSFDPIRPLIARNHRVEPWYRYNALLYVADAAVAQLPPEVLATEMSKGTAIPERASPLWRLRNGIIAHLPGSVARQLVRAKHLWGIWRAKHAA